MANIGADYNTDLGGPDPDPTVHGQVPLGDITGMVHPSFTGIHSVVPGLWDYSGFADQNELQPGVVPEIARGFGKIGKRALSPWMNMSWNPKPAPNDVSSVQEADFPATQSPVPEASPAIDDQAHTKAPKGSLADIVQNVLPDNSGKPMSQVGGRILTGPYNEARSGDYPHGSPDQQNPIGGGMAAPPTTEAGGAGAAQRADLAQGNGPNGGPTGLPGMLGKFFQNAGNFFDANRYTLMALGGGLAGSQSWGQGIGRGLQAASRVQPLDVQQNATIGYLTRSGIDPQTARAVASNPQLTQALLGQMTGIEPPKTVTLQGPMGASLMQWNPQTRKFENALGGAGGGMSGNLPANWESMNPTERLNSLDPVTRGMVQTVMEGGALPPNRMAYIMGIAKQVDPSFTENDYNAAKTMSVDLQKASPSSQGGLLANGFSAFGHLGELGDAMVGVGAYSGPNIPGGALIGQAGNLVRSTLSTPDLKSAQSQEADTALKYGEEGTKFYAATGGGEAERTAALNNATGATKLSAEKAGYLRSELGLMQRRMEDQISKLQGNPAGQRWLQNPANAARVQQMGQDIARVKHAIAQLDPTGPEAAAEKAQGAPRAQAAPQAAPQTAQQRQPVRTATNPQTGQRIADYGDGKWVPLQ